MSCYNTRTYILLVCAYHLRHPPHAVIHPVEADVSVLHPFGCDNITASYRSLVHTLSISDCRGGGAGEGERMVVWGYLQSLQLKRIGARNASDILRLFRPDATQYIYSIHV